MDHPKITNSAVSQTIRRVSADLDLEHATMLADIMNIYGNALKRIAGRSILSADDMVRVLHIHTVIADACSGRSDAEFNFTAAIERAKNAEDAHR